MLDLTTAELNGSPTFLTSGNTYNRIIAALNPRTMQLGVDLRSEGLLAVMMRLGWRRTHFRDVSAAARYFLRNPLRVAFAALAAASWRR
jgi:hypothetical protein